MNSIVTASRLALWSNSEDGKNELPGLVAALIRASCPRLQWYRFPHGDASGTHGFDGEAIVDTGNAFVPKGRSIWECGAGQDYKTKANEDYKKRTAELNPEERGDLTFIFVTSRIWDTGLKEWLDKRLSDGWLDVRVLDAVQLDHWLAECPAVAIPLARRLDVIPKSGVKTLDQFWGEYSPTFAPELKEELLLIGREERSKRLCDALSAGMPDLSKWQADSPKEAVAFVAAAIMKAQAETSRFLRTKTLVLETQEAAEIVPSSNGLILILPPAASRMGPALARKNQVILALGNDDQASGLEVLARMNTKDFAAGLKSMDFPDDEAFRLAGICGRSLTVLARLIPSGRVESPEWHKDTKLVPFVLAGGWDADNKHDRSVIEYLCDTEYERVEPGTGPARGTSRRPARSRRVGLDTSLAEGFVYVTRLPYRP